MTFRSKGEPREWIRSQASILERTGRHRCLAAEAVGQQNSRYALVWNPGFDKDIQRTRLAGDFVRILSNAEKVGPNQPF